MTVVRFANNRYQGLAADTKPTNIPDDSVFYETDTYTFYQRVSGSWVEKSVKNVSSNYDIYISGGTLKAKNNTTGLVEFTHASDVGDLTNTVINALTSGSATGGKIRYSNDLFTINTPIVIPTHNNGATEPIWFEGYMPANIRDRGTQIKIGSSFPTNRFVWESIAADASNESSNIRINGFYINNRDFAPDGNGTANILGGGTIINAGVIKYESDKTNMVGGGSPLHIEDVTWHYMYYGINILGYIYWPVIWNCSASDANIHVLSDYDIKFERGTAGAQHGATVENKGADIRNFRTTHVAGHSGGRGLINNSIVFFGGYHNVSHLFLNGGKFDDAVVAWKQCFTSVFNDIGTIDLVTPGSNFQAIFLFDSEDPAGQAATSAYDTFNNQIRKINGSNLTNTIKFVNGPFRNRILDVYAYWGGNINVNDAGAGIENVIEIIEGQQPSATTNSKITSTNSLVKIIDRRVGANNRGLSTQSGDGSDTTFDIAHSCFTTPVNWYVYPITADAMGAFDVTAGASNLTITYKVPPPGGTDNLKWSWYASVYPSS